MANEEDGLTAAMAGFKWKYPSDLPLPGPAVAREAAAKNVDRNVPLSTVTGTTAASEMAEAFLEGMHTFTAQMKESVKSQLPLTEDDKLDKPVLGILIPGVILEPEMGHKLTVSAFLVWLKSVEEALGKVSAKVPQVIAKLRGNLRIDEGDLKKMLTEKVRKG